jgi:hypothetical protein
VSIQVILKLDSQAVDPGVERIAQAGYAVVGLIDSIVGLIDAGVDAVDFAA